MWSYHCDGIESDVENKEGIEWIYLLFISNNNNNTVILLQSRSTGTSHVITIDTHALYSGVLQ